MVIVAAVALVSMAHVRIRAATTVLAGLRLDEDEVDELRGRLRMTNFATESSFVRLLLREGREEGLKEGLKEGIKEGLKEGVKEGLEKGLEQGLLQGKLGEARRLILRQGQFRFGPAAEAARQAIEALTDLDRLEQLSDRLLVVSSWDELMAEGPRGPETNAP